MNTGNDETPRLNPERSRWKEFLWAPEMLSRIGAFMRTEGATFYRVFQVHEQ